jgi:hypothetical protein
VTRAHAGFHKATLYDALRPAISPLVSLLLPSSGEEDKTRANAAGALGNLVRNSSALCGDLIRVGTELSGGWGERGSCFVEEGAKTLLPVLCRLKTRSLHTLLVVQLLRLPFRACLESWLL